MAEDITGFCHGFTVEADMQIIKKGQLPEDREYALECSNCTTEFKFKQSEGVFHSGDYKTEAYISIICPVCKRNCIAYPGKTSSMTKSELAKAYYEK